MNDEALRIHSFKANSKVFQQKFTLSQAARADTNPKGTLFKECHCLFYLPRKLSGPILRFSSVKISDVPCTGEVVGLSARKLVACSAGVFIERVRMVLIAKAPC